VCGRLDLRGISVMFYGVCMRSRLLKNSRGNRRVSLLASLMILGALIGGPVRPAGGVTRDLLAGEPWIVPEFRAQAGDVLGFEVGEERHYILGPPEALGRNEVVTWGITLESLESVEGSGSNRRAVFNLQHRREAPSSFGDPPSKGEVTVAVVDATLTVNIYGAPLELIYTSQRHIFEVGDESFQVLYEWKGDKYEKRVTLLGAKWDIDIELIEHVSLDAEVPIGIYTFSPHSLDCLEWTLDTRITQRAGTGDTSARSIETAVDTGAVEDAALGTGACIELNTDPAFANPGLLSLAMPALWEARGDSEMVLFSPLRPDLVRGQGNGIPLTLSPIIPGAPGGNVFNIIPGINVGELLGGGAGGDKDRARDPSRYFTARHMKFRDRERIQVGARRLEALPLDIAGFAGVAWVDDWGKLLRLDVPAVRQGDPERWVRLLSPSEY